MLSDRLDPSRFRLTGSRFRRNVEYSSIALIEEAEQGRNVSVWTRFNQDHHDPLMKSRLDSNHFAQELKRNVEDQAEEGCCNANDT